VIGLSVLLFIERVVLFLEWHVLNVSTLNLRIV
jgi:hypothetical protein